MSESGEENSGLAEPAEDGSDAEPEEDGSDAEPAEDGTDAELSEGEEEPEESEEPEEPPEPFSELKNMIENVIAEQISSLKNIQNLHGAHHHFKPVVIDEENSEQPEHIHNHHHFMHFNSKGDFNFKSGLVGMFRLGPDNEDYSEEEDQEEKVDRTDEFTANQLFIGGTLVASFAYIFCVLQRD